MASPDLVHRDETVTIYERPSILPHGTGDRLLEVRDRTFRNLYSASYARVPEWTAIVFVTHREGGSYKLHCFDLERRKDIAVKIDDAFGFSGSGLGQPNTKMLTCYVGKVEGDALILIERAFKTPERSYVFDRRTKRFTRNE